MDRKWYYTRLSNYIHCNILISEVSWVTQTYLALNQKEYCVEWGERAVSQSLLSVFGNPAQKDKQPVVIYSIFKQWWNNIILISLGFYFGVNLNLCINAHTSVHFCKELCVSELAAASGCLTFTFWLFRRPASSKTSFKRLLYPCSKYTHCVT